MPLQKSLVVEQGDQLTKSHVCAYNLLFCSWWQLPNSFFKWLRAFSSPQSAASKIIKGSSQHPVAKKMRYSSSGDCLFDRDDSGAQAHALTHARSPAMTAGHRHLAKCSRSVHDRRLLYLIVGDLATSSGLIHSFTKVSLEGKSNWASYTNSCTCLQEAGDKQRSETIMDQSIGVWEWYRGKSMHVNWALIFISRYLLWLQIQSNQKNKKREK